MATTYTTNYNLGKQENHADKFDMDVITDNADKIDAALTGLQSGIDGKQETLTAAQLEAVNSGITDADVEQITTDKNNIISNWGGAKNLATITSGTFTAPSGTRYTTIPLSQPISGDIVVYFGSLTSDDTQGSTCAIVVSSATETLSTINMERGSSESATVTITSEATKILIYPAAGYSTSSGKTVTWSNLMVCSKADWDKTQAYSDPAMSNVELTAAIQALQAQLANQ